jgi:hypothetical protein
MRDLGNDGAFIGKGGCHKESECRGLRVNSLFDIDIGEPRRTKTCSCEVDSAALSSLRCMNCNFDSTNVKYSHDTRCEEVLLFLLDASFSERQSCR